MDLRLVSLLLVLAYACGAWSRTTRNYQRIMPRRQQQRLPMQRRYAHLLQRPVRAISEFLEPPPLPIANHAQFHPSPSYRLRKPSSNSHNQKPNQAQGPSVLSAAATSSLPPRAQHARNGRYARPQNADPGYLSNMISWLNPFAPANVDAATAKDAHAQGSSNFPQYAPHMPYSGGPVLLRHGAPGNVLPSHPPTQTAPADQFPRTASTWTSGSSCNPCDVFPWTPVIRNDVPSYSGQYAANYESNSYVGAPPTAARPLDTPGYSYSAPSSHSAAFEPAPSNQRDNYPHLSSGATPPLYQAQPFRDAPAKDYYSASSPDQLTAPVLHQASSSSFDHHPHRLQDQQPSSLVHFQPQFQYNHAVPATSNQHYSIEIQQSPIIDVEQAPNIEQEHPPATGLDYHQAAATDAEPIQPQHEPLQHVDVPVHLDVEINSQQDADQAESRPILRIASEAADSKDRSRASSTSVHFQRSPLVELSVAGESTPAGSNRLLPTKPKAKANDAESSTVSPSVTLIDYIVSSPRETTSRQETRPTAITTSTTSTTSTTTTTSTEASLFATPDQKQQESRLETLVQSYEFYKKKSNRTKYNETMTTTNNSAGRAFSSEIDDFSASREALAPSNSSDSAKKIIIPYTSQYTPSPFHPTKSVSQRGGDEPRSEQTTPRHVQVQQQGVGDNSIEDSLPIIQESRRVPVATVTRALEPALRNNHTGNSIDVHRLQKNIDNWTIQEFSKKTSAIRNLINATYPRWISSKQIPDEYLLATTAEEDSNEYYDFNHETQLHRGINPIQVTTSTTTTTTTTSTEPTSRVKVVNAIYPKSTKKPEYLPKSPSASNNSGEKEKVYVVTPVPNPNLLGVLPTAAKDHEVSRSSVRKGKVKKQDSDEGLEQAYQVLPQAVNNLAVLANAPESAAPALWGIMEHEQIAASPNQPRWRSESDVLPEPASTPVLYAGHSKVTYFRTKVH